MINTQHSALEKQSRCRVPHLPCPLPEEEGTPCLSPTQATPLPSCHLWISRVQEPGPVKVPEKPGHFQFHRQSINIPVAPAAFQNKSQQVPNPKGRNGCTTYRAQCKMQVLKVIKNFKTSTEHSIECGAFLSPGPHVTAQNSADLYGYPTQALCCCSMDLGNTCFLPVTRPQAGDLC